MAKIVIEIPIQKAFENMFRPEMLDGIKAFILQTISKVPVANAFEVAKIVCTFVKE